MQWRGSHVGSSREALFCIGFQKLCPPITSVVNSQDSTKKCGPVQNKTKQKLPVFTASVPVLQSYTSSNNCSHYMLCPEEEKTTGRSQQQLASNNDWIPDGSKKLVIPPGKLEKHLPLQWSCSHHTHFKYFSFVLGTEGTDELLRNSSILRVQPLLIKAERRNKTGRIATLLWFQLVVCSYSSLVQFQ